MKSYDKANRKIVALHADRERLAGLSSDLRGQLNSVRQLLHGTLHDLRRLSDIISTNSEELDRRLMRTTDTFSVDINNNVYYASGMLAARLAYVDIELDPQLASQQAKVRIGLYKKFEKASRILRTKLREKNINYRIVGASHTSFEASRAFELVPFLILENAVKYSPQDQTITVKFDEVVGRQIDVSVTSIGPVVAEHELPKIFERGFRGSNAGRCGADGEGLGLHMVKVLCELELIKFRASMGEPLFGLNGIEYGEFSVHLTWRAL